MRIPRSDPGGATSQVVRRTRHPLTPAVQDVGVDHRGLDAGVAQELLDSSDVVSLPEQFGGERVAQRVNALLMNSNSPGSATGTTRSSTRK